MYPRISDIINDIFGTDITLPIMSYGFFVALAFLLGTLVTWHELKRKERQGILTPITVKILKGAPAKVSELLFLGVIGFLLGFKLTGAILNYPEFVDNPQLYILSRQGSWIGGILSGAGLVLFRYLEKRKQRLPNPVYEDKLIHPYQLTGNIVLVAAISGLIGAKLFHNIEYFDDFLNDPIGEFLSFSGLTFYGGLIFGSAAVLWYCNRKNIAYYHTMDITAPALMLAYAAGRIGCHVAGDGDWGIVNIMPKPEFLAFLPDWLWAYNYPHNVLSEGILIEGCSGNYCFALAEPVFPTPIYETIVCLAFFGALWFMRKVIANYSGLLFSIYMILNGIERFFIEKIRVNVKFSLLGMNVTQAEIISTALIIAGIGLSWFFISKWKKNSPGQ